MGDSTSDLDKSFQDWQVDQTPEKLHQVVHNLTPTIQKAVRAWSPVQSPVVHDRAKLLAAQAVKSYQANRGASLDTHVFGQLRALQRLAPQIHDPLPMPERLRRDRAEVASAVEKVQNDLGREASDEEIAELTKLPRRRITKVRQMMQARIPLSAIEESEEDSEQDVPDVVAHQTTPEDEWLDAVYHDLGDIDRLVLQHRTGYRGAEVLPTNEIAKRLRMSPAAVSQRATRIQQRLDAFHAPD